MRWFSGCFVVVLLCIIILQALPFIAVHWQDLEEWLAKYGIDSRWGEYEDENTNTTTTWSTAKDCDTVPDPAEYQQAWTDLAQGKTFNIEVKVEGTPRCEATHFRNQLEVNDWKNDYDYWRQVYSALIQFDAPKMKPLLNRFAQLRQEQQLEPYEFAEAIVTFIQQMPYVLILNKTAQEAISDGEFYRTYIEVEKRPYIENIKHGIHSPIEFLHTQQGDCDTRTVLAYTILSYFEYDVAIINSPDHSMIGIHLPAYGEHLLYKGKKYFLWETTQVGWSLGMISPEHRKNLQICVPSLYSH